jgi:hypothetical protein
MAQANQAVDQDDNQDQDDDQNDQDDSEYVDIDDLIDPRLKLSTTQLGLQRLEEAPDTYQPGTLPPRLYQTNPFARQLNDDEIDGDVYELAADAMLATVEEMRQMEDGEADEEALSQAIEAFVAPTRAGRKRIATPKAVDNAAQARDAKRAKTGGRGGGRGGGKS